MAGHAELDARSGSHWLLQGGVGARRPTPEIVKQPVLDAAAVLQLLRSELVAELTRGDPSAGTVLAVGAAMNPYLQRHAPGWRELLSVRTSTVSEQLRISLPVNRRLLEADLHMVSVFDYEGADPQSRLLLSNEELGDYRFGFAPVQMKIVDRRQILLQGPEVNGEPSVMAVTSGPCVEAAWRYWDAVLATSIAAAEVRPRPTHLTARQQQVVALLADDLGDEAIAATIGVSVRTVRTDIAAVLDTLGVKSRFAAGLRLRLESSTLR